MDYNYEYVEFLINEHLVVSEENAENERGQIMGIFDWAVSQDAVVGLDVADIVDMIEGCKEIYWSNCNSKEVADENVMGKTLIERAGVAVEECGKVFLNYRGDVSLVQVNDVAESVSGTLKDNVDIYLAASTDWDMEEEYDVTALFIV